jgi:hypothetical protein
MAEYDYPGSSPGQGYFGDDLIDKFKQQREIQKLMAQPTNPFYTSTERPFPSTTKVVIDGYPFEISSGKTFDEEIKVVIRKCTAARLLDIHSSKKVSSAQKINLREMIFSNDLENLTLAEQTIYSLFDQNEQ